MKYLRSSLRWLFLNIVITRIKTLYSFTFDAETLVYRSSYTSSLKLPVNPTIFISAANDI